MAVVAVVAAVAVVAVVAVVAFVAVVAVVVVVVALVIVVAAVVVAAVGGDALIVVVVFLDAAGQLSYFGKRVLKNLNDIGYLKFDLRQHLQRNFGKFSGSWYPYL